MNDCWLYFVVQNKKSAFPDNNLSNEFDWNIINEYEPMWPNDYEKVAKDLKKIREREREIEEMEELERRKRIREERNGTRER